MANSKRYWFGLLIVCLVRDRWPSCNSLTASRNAASVWLVIKNHGLRHRESLPISSMLLRGGQPEWSHNGVRNAPGRVSRGPGPRDGAAGERIGHHAGPTATGNAILAIMVNMARPSAPSCRPRSAGRIHAGESRKPPLPYNIPKVLTQRTQRQLQQFSVNFYAMLLQILSDR